MAVRCQDCHRVIWQADEKAVGTGEVQTVWTDAFSWICAESGDEHRPSMAVLSEEPILGDLADYPLTVEEDPADNYWEHSYPEKPEWWDDPTEPRCDRCGIHAEDAVEWCGTCGNCSEHCECGAFPATPEPVAVTVEIALALVYVRAGNYGEADRRLDRLLRFLTAEDAKED